jgi:dephospho-CoA kinase
MNSSEEKLKIIGIGGLPRSGKDMLAEMFIGEGFFGVSLGDIVRNASKIRHANQPDPISRANTTETSNWLRQTKGADFALKEALELYRAASKHKLYKGLLVWSVRAPVEVDFILKNKGHLIWVEASDKIRHDRATQNLRMGEIEISLVEFKKQEDEQWIPRPDLPSEIQMNVSYVKEKATDILENESSSLSEFRQRAHYLINQV